MRQRGSNGAHFLTEQDWNPNDCNVVFPTANRRNDFMQIFSATTLVYAVFLLAIILAAFAQLEDQEPCTTSSECVSNCCTEFYTEGIRKCTNLNYDLIDPSDQGCVEDISPRSNETIMWNCYEKDTMRFIGGMLYPDFSDASDACNYLYYECIAVGCCRAEKVGLQLNNAETTGPPTPPPASSASPPPSPSESPKVALRTPPPAVYNGDTTEQKDDPNYAVIIVAFLGALGGIVISITIFQIETCNVHFNFRRTQ